MTAEDRTRTLRSCLAYQPHELQFGTSGRRGDVIHLTQLEIYINTLAELEYLQSLPRNRGGIIRGEEFYFAYDLRPSSTRYVAEQGGRGEICQAVEQAVRDAGMRPVNLGMIPTPALTYFAISRARGSIMVTGSHVPFERNGYKTNSAEGELLKEDEPPINERVRQVRERIYSQPCPDSMFDKLGLFKSGSRRLPAAIEEGKAAYIERYAAFFKGHSLSGKRILVYQHSSVGRDVLVDILRGFGADVIASGRSEAFVPLDTENVDDTLVAAIQSLVDEASAAHGAIDSVVSADGDADRPLILGVDSSARRVRFFGGDLVGMVVAEYLKAEAVVVPISCNDAIDRGSLKTKLEPKTRIGSPYVIAGLKSARERGKRVVCGWEANGGFLTGSDIERDGRTLKALPTRDAVLPVLCVLFAAWERGLSLAELFGRLPGRYGRAALLRQFPRPRSLAIIQRFSPSRACIKEAVFAQHGLEALDGEGKRVPLRPGERQELDDIRCRLLCCFTPEMGFGGITRLNYVDGVRIAFANGDVAHVRPSGNADELRIYATADSQARADEIARMGVAEPDGILRRLEMAAAES